MAGPSEPGAPPRMVSRYFLAELAVVLPSWEADGLISHDEADRLDSSYHLEEFRRPPPPKSEPVDMSRLAIRLAFLIGGLMCGCGLIAFVAANWAKIPDLGKVAIVNFGVVGLYLSGYYFWFKKQMPALGHSLIFAGAIAFGADMGMMAQAYNVSTPHYGGYGAWALGALLLAVQLRSLPLMILSLFGASIWLTAGGQDLGAGPNLVRISSASALAFAAAWVTQFRWMHVVGAFLAIVAATLYVGQTTESDGFVRATLLIIAALLAGLSAARRSFVGKSAYDEVGEIGSWLLATCIFCSSAMTLIWNSTSIYAFTLHPLSAEARNGVWLMGGLAVITALSFAVAVLKARPSFGTLFGPGIIAASVAGIAWANVAPFMKVTMPTASVASVLFGLLLGSAALTWGVNEAHRMRFVFGYLILLFASVMVVWIVGEGLASFGISVATLMVLAALWAEAGWLVSRQPSGKSMSTGLSFVPWLVIGVTASIASFHQIWKSEGAVTMSSPLSASAMDLAGLLSFAAVMGAVFALMTMKQAKLGSEVMLLLSGALLLFAGIAPLFAWPYEVSTALSILASVGFGSCLVAKGLADEERALFWLGAIYLVGSVLIRFFEYETSQLMKSVAFLTCGAVVLLAGAYFERRNRPGVPHAH